MFAQYSMVGTGVIITVVQFAFDFFGIVAPESSIAAGVDGLIQFIGLCLLVIGQLRREDLNAGIIRK